MQGKERKGGEKGGEQKEKDRMEREKGGGRREKRRREKDNHLYLPNKAMPRRTRAGVYETLCPQHMLVPKDNLIKMPKSKKGDNSIKYLQNSTNS